MTFSPGLEAKFAELVKSYPRGRQRSALIPMLLFAQDEVGAITSEVVDDIAGRLGITPLQVDEVIGYYSMLHKKPMGKFHVQICTNISCLLTGGEALWEHARKKLGLGNKEVTADGRISIEEVECIGACSWAPAVQVNYDFFHRMTVDQLDRLLDSLGKLRDGEAPPETPANTIAGKRTPLAKRSY